MAEQELSAPQSRIDVGELHRALDERFSAAHAVAHRIVHGGERFREAVVIDDNV